MIFEIFFNMVYEVKEFKCLIVRYNNNLFKNSKRNSLKTSKIYVISKFYIEHKKGEFILKISSL